MGLIMRFIQLLANSVASGVTYVAAAGNEGQDAGSFVPASFPEVITVSAIVDTDGKCGSLGFTTSAGDDDTLADFSNYGSVVDIAAPGVLVKTTSRGGSTASFSGTSASTPHVTGAAALYESTHSGVTPSGIRDALRSSGSTASTVCDGKGHGYFTGDKDSSAEPLLYVANGSPPTDSTPPTVVSTNPSSSATGFPITSSITATFSEAVQPATVTTSTYTLKNSAGTSIAGTVSISPDNKVATFDPTVTSLTASTSYTATITTGVKDTTGNAMTSAKSWSFTTAAASDTTPPTVTSTNPASGATGVTATSSITATFSEAVQPATVTTSTYTLKNSAGTSIAGTVSISPDNKVATFDPTVTSLTASTSYTATITTGVKDTTGNAMTSAKSWSFTTAAASDTTPPTVTSTNPASGATGVTATSSITATFSEAVQPATVTTSTYTLKNSAGTSIAGTVSISPDNKVATFDPTVTSLTASTSYTATITTGVKDTTGNAMTSAKSWSFTTAAASDTTPPTVTSTNPASGATGVTATFINYSYI